MDHGTERIGAMTTKQTEALDSMLRTYFASSWDYKIPQVINQIELIMKSEEGDVSILSKVKEVVGGDVQKQFNDLLHHLGLRKEHIPAHYKFTKDKDGSTGEGEKVSS